MLFILNAAGGYTATRFGKVKEHFHQTKVPRSCFPVSVIMRPQESKKGHRALTTKIQAIVVELANIVRKWKWRPAASACLRPAAARDTTSHLRRLWLGSTDVNERLFIDER